MFGLLMQDNAPVDFPFRRSGSAPSESVRIGFVPGGTYFPARAMGYVPGGPYYPRGNPMRFRGYGIPPRVAARVPQYNGFGWVDATGGGDEGTESDSSPVPGTVVQSESTGWDKIATGVLNLGTAITGAVVNATSPHSGPAGGYCPSGYVLSNGRCVPMQSGSNTGMLLGAVGIGIAALIFLRK